MSVRPKRIRCLTPDQIRAALEVDVPSGSDDDRFGLSDDSDMDKDYEQFRRDSSESEVDCVSINDNKENVPPEKVTLQGGDAPSTAHDGERPAKRAKTKRKVWKWNKSDLAHTPVPVNKFGGKEMEGMSTPLDFFPAMVGSNNFSLIAEESNIYLYQMNKDRVKLVTTEEVRKFVGILMYMSLVKLPQRRMYWSSQLRQDNVAKCMTCNRFEEILMIFHLSDNDLQPAVGSPCYDRLYKVRSFLNSLQANFRRYANPETHMCVDEQMIPFKGQHSLKVYMKNKPSKWGYKVWVLAGASGYIYNFQISGDAFDSDIAVPDEIGKSGQVVMEFSKDLPAGTHLYFDNYFASPLLLLALKEKGLESTCTLRGGRKGGAEKKMKTEAHLKSLGRGSYEYRKSTDGVLIVQWYDNKLVTVGSTYNSCEPVSPVRRWSKSQKQYISLEKPNTIDIYNKFMGGVDKADMMLAFYRNKIRSRKWYKRIVFHFLDVCVTNAWTLSRNVNTDWPHLFNFKLNISLCLMNGSAMPLNMRRSDVMRLAPLLPVSDIDPPQEKTIPDDVRLDSMHQLQQMYRKNSQTVQDKLWK